MRASEFPPATSRQLAVLRWVYAYKQDRGYPPTQAELAKQFGHRKGNMTMYYLDVLERKGYVERLNGASRALTFTQRAREVCEKVPVLRESRCSVCNTATFAPHLPCFECKRQRAA